jgi:hypothetical protein
MAQAKKITLYIVIVFALYIIITMPDRATKLVGVGFRGISTAALGVGEFMTDLAN